MLLSVRNTNFFDIFKIERKDEMENSIFYEAEQLKQGKKEYLPIVYTALISKNPQMIKQAGNAISNYLESYKKGSQIIQLDKQFRQYTSMEWYLNWTELNVEEIQPYFESEKDYIAILILGSFHPNGYFRTHCIKILAEFPKTLPYLILRLNDWVKEVRIFSEYLICGYLKRITIEEILSALPFLKWIERCQRREYDIIIKLRQFFLERLSQALKEIPFKNICYYDFETKKVIYQMLLEYKIIDYVKAQELLELEKNTYCKSIIFTKMLTLHSYTLEEIEPYLKNKNVNIRKEAFFYKYNKLKTVWDGIEEFLFDSSHTIREFTQYLLKKETGIDIRELYLKNFSSKPINSIIVGIGETGKKEDALFIEGFLSDSSIQRVRLTLLALGRLLDKSGERLYWNYLFDSRVGISKAAYINIQRSNILYGAYTLYQAYQKSNLKHVKEYLFQLLLLERFWEQIPYLLLLYEEADLKQKNQICSKIQRRTMYAQLSKEEVLFIRDTIKKTEHSLPPWIKKELEYDLKFIEKK